MQKLVLITLLTVFPLSAEVCKKQAQKLSPPVVLTVGEDNRLHMVVKGGKTKPAQILGSLLTASASPFWLKEMSDVIARVATDRRPVSAPQKMLDTLDVGYKLQGSDLATIPKEGKLLIIANHNRFGLEALAIVAALEGVRTDIKIVGNEMMQMVPGFKEHTIGVNMGGTRSEKAASQKEMGKWLDDGHALLIFPAGKVSRLDKDSGTYQDPPWNPGVARMVERHQAPVLPIFVSGGQPGFWFRATDRWVSKPVKSIYPMEILRQQGEDIPLTIGQPISPKVLQNYSPQEATQFLREQTYRLDNTP